MIFAIFGSMYYAGRGLSMASKPPAQFDSSAVGAHALAVEQRTVISKSIVYIIERERGLLFLFFCFEGDKRDKRQRKQFEKSTPARVLGIKYWFIIHRGAHSAFHPVGSIIQSVPLSRAGGGEPCLCWPSLSGGAKNVGDGGAPGDSSRGGGEAPVADSYPGTSPERASSESRRIRSAGSSRAAWLSAMLVAMSKSSRRARTESGAQNRFSLSRRCSSATIMRNLDVAS